MSRLPITSILRLSRSDFNENFLMDHFFSPTVLVTRVRTRPSERSVLFRGRGGEEIAARVFGLECGGVGQCGV